ncbi:MAG: hypothetical protein PHR47_00770 [Candidatus Pacebacteria bacterium]|nr:hypothetical protein [Candidatus Paceibacterota bacterium]
MKTENSKFDLVILCIVSLIGFIFIGISLMAVIKNNPEGQLAESNLSQLQTRTSTVPINGICGASNGRVFENSPTTELCSTGNPSVIVLEDNPTGKFFVWQCIGSGGGIMASCSATANINSSTEKLDGMCGSSNKTKTKQMPTLQEEYCSAGNYVKGACETPVYDNIEKKWQSVCSWFCSGSNGGIAEKCFLTLVK